MREHLIIEPPAVESTESKEPKSLSAVAEAQESGFLSKFRGKAKEIARILVFMTALTAGGKISKNVAAQEQKQFTQTTSEKKEVSTDEKVKKFISSSKRQQEAYLMNLSKIPQSIIEREGFSICLQSGIYNLKEDLEKLLENAKEPTTKEEIKQAFSIVHHFILENDISNDGRQAVKIYPVNNPMELEPSIYDYLNKRSLQNIHNKGLLYYQKYLEEGETLKKLEQKAKRITDENELAKIRKVYNLVAEAIPRYKARDYYRSSEEALQKGEGQCFDKNAILVHILRSVGINAHLWGFENHAYTRISTEEGILDVDVTNSNSFTLRTINTTFQYTASLRKDIFMDMDNALKIKESLEANNASVKISLEESLFYIFMKITFDANKASEIIKKIIADDFNSSVSAKVNNFKISEDDVDTIISRLCKVKPHPLYKLVREVGDNITPKNAQKYRDDLFPNLKNIHLNLNE